jgi:SAM-dependent methyltransferase
MLFASQTPIITCTSANEVKGAISIFCRPKDVVLEFGSELSDVSLHLCNTIGPGGKAFLVDKKRSVSNSGNVRSVDIFLKNEELDSSFADRFEYIELDNLSEQCWREKLFCETTNSHDILILSVAHIVGNDLYMTTLTLASEMMRYSQPRAIIIKSKTLYALSRRLVHSQRLFDNTTTLPADMKRGPEPYLIAGVKVEEYRKTIPFIVRKEDSILEVGCHFGRTTHLLNEEGRYCIGVDIGPKIIANAKKQYPGIDFAVGDAWRTLALLKLRSTFTQEVDLGYDLVYADIGGLSGADGLLESLSLLESLGNALEPRCIVIKSLCMRQLASRLKFFPDVWAKHNNTTTKAKIQAAVSHPGRT